MAIFNCKMCGGSLEINENQTTAVCQYCCTQQTLPRLDNDRKANLYDRANHFRRSNDFDKAMSVYERILSEDGTDSEAYWSLVLCRYGIEYVEEPSTHKRVPTVNRAQFTSIFADEDYKSALEYADSFQRKVYEAEARAIDAIQKGILAISQREAPFDVFICYKETDDSGRRTQDSVLANDLYHQLTQEGFKVFFSRITLEDKLGQEYEPYIFAALNSAKVMVVIGTRAAYLNAVWVKNEWSRYLALVKLSGGKKTLIPAYRDMDPYDLPEEFSHLQAQDMSRLGFMQDLIRGIKKLASSDEPKPSAQAAAAATPSVSSLLERGKLFLEDCDWQSADEYFDKVLDIDPKYAPAYVGKLCAELQVRNMEGLPECGEPFDVRNNYQKALRFSDAELKEKLGGAVLAINERNERNRLQRAYADAAAKMKNANTEQQFMQAATQFSRIQGYRDADEKAELCRQKAEQAAKEQKLREERLEAERRAEQMRRAERQRIENQLKQEYAQRIQLLREQTLGLENNIQTRGKLSRQQKKEAELIIQKNRDEMVSCGKEYAKRLEEYGCQVLAARQYAHMNMISDKERLMRQYPETVALDPIVRVTNANIGDAVTLGKYHYESASDMSPLKWIVINRNGGFLLLLSADIIDYQPYALNSSLEWKDSNIRQWLNDKFAKKAFNDTELSIICSTTGGDLAKDMLFFLSLNEAKQTPKPYRAAKLTPYAFNKIQGQEAKYKNTGLESVLHCWWLRTPAKLNTQIKVVLIDGSLSMESFPTSASGVRPAMWVKIGE